VSLVRAAGVRALATKARAFRLHLSTTKSTPSMELTLRQQPCTPMVRPMLASAASVVMEHAEAEPANGCKRQERDSNRFLKPVAKSS
jgi:hypothetical protein